MNIFETLRVYGSWTVTAVRKFTAAEKAVIKDAIVTDHTFEDGRTVRSVCFMTKSGNKQFITLSNDSIASVGEVVDMESCELLTLSKQGENDIIRVRVN